VWSVLWVATIQAITALSPASFTPAGAATSAGVNATFLALSVVYSILAGYVTAAIARGGVWPPLIALGVLQLALGLFFELTSWDLAPVWYHLSFLALLIPGNLAGGWLRAGRVRVHERSSV
jgi:hypothetical protein